MSNTATKKMLDMFSQDAEAPLFLAKMFSKVTLYKTKKVEIDIERDDEDVAVVITDMATGHRWNTSDQFTSKEFEAPAYSEAVTLDSFKLMERMPGRSPLEDPQFRADAIKRIQSTVLKIQKKISRAIEWQASQVLQTGTVELPDQNGNVLYSIDYSPKASHFPDAAIDWDEETAVPLADLGALMTQVRTDGKKPPAVGLFGARSWDNFMKSEAVRQQLDTRRAVLGEVNPTALNGDGATLKGYVDIGNYKLECWGYDGRYKHPQTGVSHPFLAEDQVTVRAATGRLDATFGDVPNIGREFGAQSTEVIPSLPRRISLPGQGIDLHVNVWFTPDGRHLSVSVDCRPLLIPVAIDTFGSLNTGV